MYLGYQNGKIKFYSEEYLNPSFYQLDKQEYTDKEYVLDGEEYVLKDEVWEEKQAQKERERIGNLKCTKRVFALMLQELGVDYITVLLPLIESNSRAKLEWDLCVELERKNPLLDIMALQLGITSEQLDGLFRYANGEITIEQFRELIPEPDVNNSEPTIKENLTVEGITEEDIVNNEN